MADEQQGSNTAVTETTEAGAHDRVAMLSLRKDGSHDQHDPELIGDKDATLEATKEQFRQQAVSSVDEKLRATYVPGADEGAPEDPTVEELRKAHESAAEQAESDAETAVDALLVEKRTSDRDGAGTTNQPAGAAPSNTTAGVPGSKDFGPDQVSDDDNG
jgi:hypothetical protein